MKAAMTATVKTTATNQSTQEKNVMTDKRLFKLNHAQARDKATACVQTAPVGWVVSVAAPTRTLEQNAVLWPLLTDLSEQLVWHGVMLQPAQWKHLCTAALKRHMMVPAIDGAGFVDVGGLTSTMSKADFGKLIAFIYAFGVEHGVRFHAEREKCGHCKKRSSACNGSNGCNGGNGCNGCHSACERCGQCTKSTLTPPGALNLKSMHKPRQEFAA